MRKMVFILISLCLLSFSAYGFSWQDLWKTQDQQAAEALQHGKAQEASNEFQNPAWRATALYRNQQYAEAAKSFNDLNSSLGYYNEGNALAHLQQYQEAIAAYDKSLAIDPNNEDAKHNKEVLKKLLQQSSSQKQNNGNNQDKKQQQKAENNASSNESSAKNDKDKQNPSKANNSSENNNNASNNNSQNPSQANNQKQNTADESGQQNQTKNSDNENKAQQQSTAENSSGEKVKIATGNKDASSQQEEQMLQQLSDNPGGLLQQKFLRDSQRYAQDGED